MIERFLPLLHMIRRIRIPWFLLVGACALTLIDVGIGLWIPLVTRDLIESATGGAIPRGIVLTLVAALLVEAAFSAASLYLMARAGEGLTADLRQRVVDHLLRLPMSVHDDRQSGELVSRTMSDTQSIQSLLTEQLVSFIAGLVSMVGAVVILWLLDWKLTLVLFGSALGAVLLVLPVAARLHVVGRDTQDQLASFSGRLASVLADIRLVKASCAEDEEARRAESSIQALRGLGVREAKIMAVLGPTVTVGMSGALVMILGYGGARVASGALTVGTLVAFILYLFQVVFPMIQFTAFLAALNKAAGAAEHLGSLLEEPAEDPVSAGLNPQKVSGADLVFENVSHSYGTEEVLSDIHLRVPCGKVTALVGPSGGGKTSLLSLVERLYTPTGGTIRLADTPIDQYALEPWRRRIGYVSQEAPLLGGTVRENVCFGLDPVPGDEKLMQALRAARAEGFVARLEQGLDTEVGERGTKLSGGQRQRLAIARAFLVDPELLMLDEATANLDSDSEAAIRAALTDLRRDRTTLIVAHRLATVRDADQIAVLEEGTITGTGRHDELLSSNATYRRLVQQQDFGEAVPA